MDDLERDHAVDLARAFRRPLDPMDSDGWYPDPFVERRRNRLSEAEWLDALVRHGFSEFMAALKEREPEPVTSSDAGGEQDV